MPFPQTLVNGVLPLSGALVTPGSTVTLQIADPTGVNQWTLNCFGTSENSSPTALNSATVITDPLTKTAQISWPNTAGLAGLFTSQVNGGVDVNGKLRPEWTYRFKISSPLSGSITVGALNETDEAGQFGWLPLINNSLRTAVSASSGGGGSSFTAAGDLSGSASFQSVTGVTGAPGGTLSFSPAISTVDSWSALSGSVRRRELTHSVSQSGAGPSRATLFTLSMGGWAGTPVSMDFRCTAVSDDGRLRDYRATRLFENAGGTWTMRTHSAMSDCEDNARGVSGSFGFGLSGGVLTVYADLTGSVRASAVLSAQS